MYLDYFVSDLPGRSGLSWLRDAPSPTRKGAKHEQDDAGHDVHRKNAARCEMPRNIRTGTKRTRDRQQHCRKNAERSIGILAHRNQAKNEQ
jgi:hypothetical protein